MKLELRRGRLALSILALVAALGLAGAWVWRALEPPSPLAHTATDFTLAGVTAINPMRERIPDAVLAVRGRTIHKLEQGEGAAAPSPLERYRGAWVLPGLVDMHTHLPPDNPLKLSGYFAFLFLAHGVTSVRDAGDPDGTAVPTARRAIAHGVFPGPRVFSCGPFVAGAEPVRWPNTVILRTPADAGKVAARIEAEGHICLKSYDDLTLEKIQALKTAAEGRGLWVIGHVPTQLAYEQALLPEVQHFFGVPPPESLRRDHVLNRTADWQTVDDERLDFIVATTIQHGIVNTPTLVSSHQLLLFRDYEAARRDPIVQLVPRLYPDVAWNPTDGMPVWRGVEDFLDQIEDAVAKKTELLRRLHAAGAELRLGTDTQQPFVVPGASLHQEMRHFAEAGIRPEEIWAMATWKAGADLRLPGLGSLRADAPADFLIFRKDPTRDLAHLDTLEAVVAEGKLYAREDLDAAREVYQRHFRSAVVDAVSNPAARFALKRSVLRDY